MTHSHAKMIKMTQSMTSVTTVSSSRQGVVGQPLIFAQTMSSSPRPTITDARMITAVIVLLNVDRSENHLHHPAT